MSLRRAGCLAVLAVVSVLVFTVDKAECITVRPAAFDRVLANVPEEVMAGVEFKITVTFVDRYGNPMADNWKPEDSLTLVVSQPASVTPATLTPENYVSGFTFRVHTEKMGDLTLSLRDAKSRILDQWDLKIKSGRPVKLLVDLPSRAEAGETVIMSLKAVDAHGNVAFGYKPRVKNLVLEDNTAAVAGEIEDKEGGIYELPIKFKTYGQRSVTLRDRERGLTGSSSKVTVVPAPLGSFDLKTASVQSTAGRELALTIRALDQHGNLVTDYSSRYKGVRLYSKAADVVPDLVPPSSFNGGVAKMNLVIKSAGDHTIKVSELQSNISGDFSILIVPAKVNKLLVKTPDSATAGEQFEITITAQDQFGNRTQKLPPGSRVRLNSTGSGTIKPGIVDNSEFTKGVARLKVSYEKAESFEIFAELEDSGNVSAKPLPADDEAGKARSSALKARDEAKRARRESRLREKRVSKKISQKQKTPVPAPVKQTPPDKSAESVKAPESSTPVVASKKLLRPGILDKIAVTEETDKALVIFSTNGMTDYNVTTSAKLSRNWIDLEFPDMTVDLPARIGGGEKIVGEVYVEPSVGGGPGVRVSVEILTSRIEYDVYQEGHSIVLKVNRQ